MFRFLLLVVEIFAPILLLSAISSLLTGEAHHGMAGRWSNLENKGIRSQAVHA
jgi:hypothetical protein